MDSYGIVAILAVIGAAFVFVFGAVGVATCYQFGRIGLDAVRETYRDTKAVDHMLKGVERG